MSLRHSSVAGLRARAESRVGAQIVDDSAMSTLDVRRLVYELEIHQEELLIQNEELRHAQTALQKSVKQYGELYEFAPVGYLTTDESSEIVTANLTAAAMLGRERSRVVGVRLDLYLSPDSRRVFQAKLRDTHSSEQLSSCEVQLVNPQGVSHARLDINRNKDSDDSGSRFRITMTDITERREAEIAASRKDSHLQSLADALPVLICYVDTKSVVRFSNPTFARWMKVTTDEIEGNAFTEFFGSFQGFMDNFVADALDGRRVDFETQVFNSRNQPRRIQMMFVPDFDENRKVVGLHALGIDVTERVMIEEVNARRRDFDRRLGLLTTEERDVYNLLVQGKSNKAIAFHLDISLRTTERRRHEILVKLDIESLAELLSTFAEIYGVTPA